MLSDLTESICESGAAAEVSEFLLKMMSFVFTNDEICVKNDEFRKVSAKLIACQQMVELELQPGDVSTNDEFCIQNEVLCL